MIAEQNKLFSSGTDSSVLFAAGQMPAAKNTPESADEILCMPTSCEKIQPRFPKELQDKWGSDSGLPSSRIIQDLQESDPDTAQRLAQAVAAMPEAGSDFLGFRLLADLGRGAFARVYL